MLATDACSIKLAFSVCMFHHADYIFRPCLLYCLFWWQRKTQHLTHIMLAAALLLGSIALVLSALAWNKDNSSYSGQLNKCPLLLAGFNATLPQHVKIGFYTCRTLVTSCCVTSICTIAAPVYVNNAQDANCQAKV